MINYFCDKTVIFTYVLSVTIYITDYKCRLTLYVCLRQCKYKGFLLFLTQTDNMKIL